MKIPKRWYDKIFVFAPAGAKSCHDWGEKLPVKGKKHSGFFLESDEIVCEKRLGFDR